jgi:hypothetical protein
MKITSWRLINSYEELADAILRTHFLAEFVPTSQFAMKYVLELRILTYACQSKIDEHQDILQ